MLFLLYSGSLLAVLNVNQLQSKQLPADTIFCSPFDCQSLWFVPEQVV